MESEKKTNSEQHNTFTFLLGKWAYSARSSLVERYWTKPGSIQCTPTHTFTSTTGTVEYRDILYGSHVHGEYRQDARSDMALMSILLQRAAGAGVEMTVAAADDNRFSGAARLNGGSIVLEGGAIPFFVGDYLQEAHVPLVPRAESRPLTRENIGHARIALHPLRSDRWLLVVYHVLMSTTGHATLLKTEVWHFRPESKASLEDGDQSTARQLQPQDTPNSPSAFADLEARLVKVERKLAERRAEYEEIKNELEVVKSEQENAVDEIVDLDLASFGWNDAECTFDSGSPSVAFDGTKWQNKYASLLDLMEKVHELDDELGTVQDDIDELEHEADELEEALERGHAKWEAKEYRKAEALSEQARAHPASPEKRLLGEAAVGCLSNDARTILETYLIIDCLYTEQRDLQSLDCGPLVASMSKLCERILADFLGPRCPAIYADSVVSSLLNDPKRTVDVPVEDQAFIDKGSLRKVLGLIEKPGPVKWSGTRNCAIALLLFGRTYKMGEGEGEEVTNPLKVHGTEEERRDLRLDLYRFQHLRNRFIHHDLAEWTEALEVKQCFERCVRGSIRILFGVSPTAD
jgi:hypothetical protein